MNLNPFEGLKLFSSSDQIFDPVFETFGTDSKHIKGGFGERIRKGYGGVNLGPFRRCRRRGRRRRRQ